MTGFFQILNAAFFSPAGDVLDHGALTVPQPVGKDVFDGLDSHVLVVVAAYLIMKWGRHLYWWHRHREWLVCSWSRRAVVPVRCSRDFHLSLSGNACPLIVGPQ